MHWQSQCHPRESTSQLHKVNRTTALRGRRFQPKSVFCDPFPNLTLRDVWRCDVRAMCDRNTTASEGRPTVAFSATLESILTFPRAATTASPTMSQNTLSKRVKQLFRRRKAKMPSSRLDFFVEHLEDRDLLSLASASDSQSQKELSWLLGSLGVGTTSTPGLVGTEQRLNTSTKGPRQDNVAVAGFDDGGYVAVWESKSCSATELVAQRTTIKARRWEVNSSQFPRPRGQGIRPLPLGRTEDSSSLGSRIAAGRQVGKCSLGCSTPMDIRLRVSWP